MKQPQLRGKAAAVLLVAACAACDGSPSEPVPAQRLAPPEQVAAFLPAVSDAVERVVTGLSDATAAGDLAARLVALDEALVRRDVRTINTLLSELRIQLTTYPAPGRVQDGAELSAIELVLDGVQRLLTGTDT